MTPGSTPAPLAASVRSGELVADREPAHDQRNELGLVGAGGVCRDHRSAVFSSAHVEWGTPPDLKAALEKEFRFTLDPCTPGQVWDGCALSWVGHRVFCNPPYGRKAKVERWLAKASEAECAVFLLPARTDTGWFHDYALKADEIRFIRGRLKFVENHRICPKETWLEGAPFPSVLVIFRAGGGGAELAGDGNATNRSRAGSATDAVVSKNDKK